MCQPRIHKEIMDKLHHTRREYDHSSLSRNQLDADPFRQAREWIEQASEAELKDATSMTLATTDAESRPDARIVLLKQLDDSGFSWYTHYDSTKGRQLAQNPNACLLFYWRDFDRQLRVQGKVEKLPIEQADAYFHSRPLQSQFSAAASHQSQPVEDRETLERRVAELMASGADQVERPADWGGYCLIPESFEFWQGRENRLHDRFVYTRNNNGEWQIQRLQP